MNILSILTATDPSRRRYQHLLRRTLVLILIAALGWLGLRLIRARIQEHEVLALRRLEGCRVRYAGEEKTVLQYFKTPPRLAPVTWTEALLGKHFVHRAEIVELPADRVDEAVAHVKRLPYLRKIEVYKYSDRVGDKLQEDAEKIRSAMPNVETVVVGFDPNLDDRIRSHR